MRMGVWVTNAAPSLTPHTVAAVTIILTAICATASYHLVEMPIRTWAASRLEERSTTTQSAASPSESSSEQPVHSGIDGIPTETPQRPELTAIL
jgi:peptidoglycan/LPS O-acetylase OafA/YrhL